MARRRKGSVRMGPISIFSLVIALCLAVMATLSVSTAKATYAATERQAESTASVYASEVAAQQFMAEVDAQLQAAGTGNRAEALSVLQENVNALAEAGASGNVTVNVQVAGEDASDSVPTLADRADVKATFGASDGRTLNVALALTDSGTYQVLQWKTTTNWTETDSAGTKLWSPATNDEE